MPSEPIVRMVRILEYTGTLTDINHCIKQNAVKGFRDFGHIQIREAALPFPEQIVTQKTLPKMSDMELRVLIALIEECGGSAVISRKSLEQAYLNTTAEYNWGLEDTHMPDGSMIVSIVKQVGTAEDLPNVE